MIEEGAMESSNELFWGMSENTYIVFMHISQFSGYIAPLLGFILPLVMWLSNKDKSALIDEHGKNIINWLISLMIYAIISAFLVFIVVGIVTLIILGILAILYPIIGAIRASNGSFFKYPLTIKFIK